VSLRAAHDSLNARHQFVPVEWLGHVVVGAEAETLDLVHDADNAGEDQDRCLHLGDAQGSEHLEARHIGQVQVEQDDVVIIERAESEALYTSLPLRIFQGTVASSSMPIHKAP
jgi:hypothetical protein